MSELEQLRAENQQLRDALALWEKFAWYASGDSGNTPLEMNLWQATLFVNAREQAQAALGATRPAEDAQG